MARRRWLTSMISAALVVACSSTPAASPPSPDAAPTTSVAGSPSATVSASTSAAASASSSSTTFTSPLYGYTVTLPAGWTAQAATVKWNGQGAPGNDDPAVDRFLGPGSASAFGFAAPITSDLTGYATDVIARNVKFHGDTCPPKPDATEETTVGSEPGAFIAFDCGILINIAVTLHEGTGYEFVFRDAGVHQAADTTDRSTFDSILGSVSYAS
jgi:hypothetical protein